MGKKKVAVLLASGFEDSEFDEPVRALREAGHEVIVIGAKKGEKLEGKNGDVTTETDVAIGGCDPSGFDALLIPGGWSPDHLRTDAKMVAFTKSMADADKPIAAVCHGPQLLIEADVVRGRRMTSFESVRTDLRNAGANVVDEEVVLDGPFITSRTPEDLPAFSKALVSRLS